MWPARRSDGKLQDVRPDAPTFAVSHSNTIDLDYARDADGRPMSTGLRVKPRDGHAPAAILDGSLSPVGKVARVVRNRRPGRPAMVWVEFPRRDNPDVLVRLSFTEHDLVVVGSASGM